MPTGTYLKEAQADHTIPILIQILEDVWQKKRKTEHKHHHADLSGCVIKTGGTEKELTEEQLQANQAAHKVVKVDVEVLAVAGHDYLMQRVVEREACQHATCDQRCPWSVCLWLFTWRDAFWEIDFSHQQPRQPSSSQWRSCSHFDPCLRFCICSNVDVNRWGPCMLVSLGDYSYVCVGNGHKPGTYQEFINLCPQDPEFYQP